MLLNTGFLSMDFSGLWIGSWRVSISTWEYSSMGIPCGCLITPTFKENMWFCFQYIWSQAATEAGGQAVAPLGDEDVDTRCCFLAEWHVRFYLVLLCFEAMPQCPGIQPGNGRWWISTWTNIQIATCSAGKKWQLPTEVSGNRLNYISWGIGCTCFRWITLCFLNTLAGWSRWIILDRWCLAAENFFHLDVRFLTQPSLGFAG